MGNKVVLVAFREEPMCLVHVWLNALDMHKKGMEIKVVLEGASTQNLIQYHKNPKAPFVNFFQECFTAGLIDAVCKACATKMGALDAAVALKLPIRGEMSGHPSLGAYIADGYQILTF
jgi:hypothetical protein